MAKQLIPFYNGTMRQWKSKKRKELRAVLKAVEEFRLGCAYTPCYPDPAHTLDTLLKEMERKLSVKYWGR